MPIDTSSYYPEVPGQNGGDDRFSLNNREGGLFGDKPSDNPSPGNNPDENIPPQPSGQRDKDYPASDAERILTIFSNALSWVLVPLMMPVYGLILAFGLSILDIVPINTRVMLTLITAGINVIIPIILIILMKRAGVIQDVGLNGQKERAIPYVISIVALGATAWFMAMKGAPLWLSLFFAGGALAGMINFLINFRWKISAHAAGIAGVVALLIRIAKDSTPEPQLFTWLILTIVVAGLLGSARIWLGRHNCWQILAGYAVGFCCVFFISMIH